MSRLLFNSPMLLGFDHIERMLDRAGKAQTGKPAGEGYPPYNIERTGENALCITLAVAGFGEDELSIQVEGNQLQIRGKQSPDEDRVYLHRGIATRQFQRTFILAEGLEASGARLEHGLLHIDLVRPTPENRVRAVKINETGSKAKNPMGNGAGTPVNVTSAKSAARGLQEAERR